MKMTLMFAHYRRKHGISGKQNGNIHIWHSDFLEMAWYQPQTSIVNLMQLSNVVLWTKQEMCEIKDTQKMYRNVYSFISSPKFPTTSRVWIITLWIYGNFVCVLYWHRAKATGCRIKIGALKQNGRKVWFKVQHFLIWYFIENMFHLYKSCLLKS